MKRRMGKKERGKKRQRESDGKREREGGMEEGRLDCGIIHAELKPVPGPSNTSLRVTL